MCLHIRVKSTINWYLKYLSLRMELSEGAQISLYIILFIKVKRCFYVAFENFWIEALILLIIFSSQSIKCARWYFQSFTSLHMITFMFFISIFTSSACFPENRLLFLMVDKLVEFIFLNIWYSLLSIDSSTSFFSSSSKIIRSCWKSRSIFTSLILASRCSTFLCINSIICLWLRLFVSSLSR